MLTTQRQAIKRLRRETNRSLDWCEQVAKRLATVKDGQRLKLKVSDLDQVIDQQIAPTPAPKPVGIRPLSPRKADKVRSYA